MKRFVLVISVLFFCLATSAQVTKVRGRVLDISTGEPVPYAAVIFKGTTIGVTTDEEGNYSLETRNATTDTLECRQLGYDTVEKVLRLNAFSEVDFWLTQNNLLQGVTVKADDRKIKRLLAGIEEHRDRNNPEARDAYSCDIYSKIELDLQNAREYLKGRKFRKELGFVFDYMDTSAVTGKSYLPVMISESQSKRLHRGNPSADSETIVANRVSGVNPDGNILSQFTGAMHIRNNFYDDYVNSFDVNFPSPLQKNGLLFYNYFVVDSLQMDGRKTYVVRFHPKENVSIPVLDGEMKIDAEDFALHSIHARMKKGGNVNWLRDIVLGAEYQRIPDNGWFYRKSSLFADFSLVLSDSTKTLALIGNRELYFENPSFEGDFEIGKGEVLVDKDANHRDEEYWRSARPYELNDREKSIYTMVDRIRKVPLFNTLYDVVETAINGFWDVGKIGFGPYSKLVSFNNCEGARIQLGIHTSKDLSRKFRFTVFGAYGIKDRAFKGGLCYEQLFSKEPTRKLTVDARYDTYQLGRGASNYTDGNILSSLLAKGNAQKLCPMSSFSAGYEHEVNIGINLRGEVAMKRYFANDFVPMFMEDGSFKESVASNELHLQARFSWSETVHRGDFIKSYVHTVIPVVTLDLSGGISGLRKDDVAYFKPELSIDWNFNIPVAGKSRLHFNAGTIVGQVPYPLLHLHEGNGTYLLDKTAFSCMEFFEFASDSWVSLMWHHNFNGLILGYIPLVKELNLREEISFKGSWGRLSDRNNAILPETAMAASSGSAGLKSAGGTESLCGSKGNDGHSEFGNKMLFPEGMKAMGNVPYLEVGVGVTNIFRLFRVDCSWRLTHRDEARRKFCVTLGLEFRF